MTSKINSSAYLALTSQKESLTASKKSSFWNVPNSKKSYLIRSTDVNCFIAAKRWTKLHSEADRNSEVFNTLESIRWNIFSKIYSLFLVRSTTFLVSVSRSVICYESFVVVDLLLNQEILYRVTAKLPLYINKETTKTDAFWVFISLFFIKKIACNHFFSDKLKIIKWLKFRTPRVQMFYR